MAQRKSIEDAVFIGEEEDLYKLKGHSETTLVHETTSPSELWNRSVSHINYKALPNVRKVVTCLLYFKIDREGICKGCAKRKNIKNTFTKCEINTKCALELIHSDVCGLIPSTYLSGYEYYVTFIDEYLRKIWIYFLKTNNEVFRKFKEF